MADVLGSVQRAILTALADKGPALSTLDLHTVLSGWGLHPSRRQVRDCLNALRGRGLIGGDETGRSSWGHRWWISDAGRCRLSSSCKVVPQAPAQAADRAAAAGNGRVPRTWAADRPACIECARHGACDRHRPPVCVCDHPVKDADGQCGGCYRPWKFRNPDLNGGMAELREAWRKFLADEGLYAKVVRTDAEVVTRA